MDSSRRWLLLLGLICLSACAALDSPPGKAGKGSPNRPVPVVVATVVQRTVPISFQTTGTVQAYATVSVKSQVAGHLTAVYFQEGQEVQKGELLFTIDPRSLQAALDQALANRARAIAQVGQAQAELAQAEAQVNQARATVTKDLAQARNAEVQAQRYTSLLNQGAVSREQVDQFRTSSETQNAIVIADQSSVRNAIAAVASAKANVQSAEAEVKAATAAVDSAKVQLSYSAIRSPIEGQTGNLKVNQGNLVKDNDSEPLVVISQVRPIYVAFPIPQRLLPDLKTYQSQGKLAVEVLPVNDPGQPMRGQLVFVDSGVDPTTGTLQLKASFPNLTGRLTPGQFVNVVLRLTEEPNALVVPSQAIQTGQQGTFVYIVNPDKTVDLRSVTTGGTVKNQIVIKQGLQAGERVVIDGQFNLVPGATVREKPAPGSGKPEPGKPRDL
ncbi:efflux RND transporter periplasmic adaptor subunit [Neosynechococcus sphagnicola]|uniref:efflux RND transporter periplasmic adaptor subunit n=1 Tax=Neosynechococcus sphagnicola TaxID=1501145 RepID=UPI000A69A071|nr:efflux RND transporter periplasmic adaptor subunit [Neosynechococcus sphagnicola]